MTESDLWLGLAKLVVRLALILLAFSLLGLGVPDVRKMLALHRQLKKLRSERLAWEARIKERTDGRQNT